MRRTGLIVLGQPSYCFIFSLLIWWRMSGWRGRYECEREGGAWCMDCTMGPGCGRGKGPYLVHQHHHPPLVFASQIGFFITEAVRCEQLIFPRLFFSLSSSHFSLLLTFILILWLNFPVLIHRVFRAVLIMFIYIYYLFIYICIYVAYTHISEYLEWGNDLKKYFLKNYIQKCNKGKNKIIINKFQ